MEINGIEIDESITKLKFACDTSKCRNDCCLWGCFITKEEIKKVNKHLDGISKHMRLEAKKTLAKKGFLTDSVEDGIHSVRVVGGKCIFLSKLPTGGEGCAIHWYCIENGIDHRDLKPQRCLLFPISPVSRGRISFRVWEIPCMKNVGKDATPVYKACRRELEHHLGSEGYETLLREAEIPEKRIERAGGR